MCVCYMCVCVRGDVRCGLVVQDFDRTVWIGLSQLGVGRDLPLREHQRRHLHVDRRGLLAERERSGVLAAVFGKRRERGIVPGKKKKKTKYGRKNVISAPYRPILSEDRTRQRPTHALSHADPAQYGQSGENRPGKFRTLHRARGSRPA